MVVQTVFLIYRCVQYFWISSIKMTMFILAWYHDTAIYLFIWYMYYGIKSMCFLYLVKLDV